MKGQVAIKTRDYYKVHDFLTVGAAAPLQEAVIPGLRFGRDYYDELLKTYTHKRDLFVQGLDAIGLEHTTPQGAYYVLMDISRYGYKSDLEFCEMLARDVGVGAVPGSSFFREGVNYLGYASAEECVAQVDLLMRCPDAVQRMNMPVVRVHSCQMKHHGCTSACNSSSASSSPR